MGRKGEKKKSPFPRGEPGGRGNAACFSSLLSPLFLYFFLSLSPISPGGFCSLPGMAENPGPVLPANHPRLPRPFAKPPKLSAAISLPPRPPRHSSQVRTWSEGSSAGSLYAGGRSAAGRAGRGLCLPKVCPKTRGVSGGQPLPPPLSFFCSSPRYFSGRLFSFFLILNFFLSCLAGDGDGVQHHWLMGVRAPLEMGYGGCFSWAALEVGCGKRGSRRDGRRG